MNLRPRATIQTLLNQFPLHLKNEGEIIIAQLLKKDRAYVLAHPEHLLTPAIARQARVALRKLRAGAPLAYLTGHKEFFGLDFFVDKNVLVPRPDTELLVEETIKIIKKNTSPATLIDIGTGSGCIPISIIKTLPRKNIKMIALDISRAALKIAAKNAARHGVKIDFRHGDLLGPITHNSGLITNGSKLIITANLPYLTAEQFNAEPSIKKEPKLALIADDKNGLSLYEKLLSQIKPQFTYCHPEQSEGSPFQHQTDRDSDCHRNDKSITVILEIDPSQTIGIGALIKNILPSAKIEIKKDLANRNRVVIVQLSTATTASAGTI